MTLDEKIIAAKKIIGDGLTDRTVVYWSSGKDSMVCLHLLRSMGWRLPIVFNRHPVFPEKESFANRMIEEWGLEVYSFPPISTALSLDPHPEIINYYTVKNFKMLLMPVGLSPEKEGEPFACGLHLINTLRGTVDYPWDAMIYGQKATDKHFLYDDMTPRAPISEVTDGLKAIFPIIDFTDCDVWEYVERFNVPYNDRRYDKASGYQEFTDERFNNDHYRACVRCMLPGEAEVGCPKFGRKVPNVHDSLNVIKVQPMAYMKGSG